MRTDHSSEVDGESVVGSVWVRTSAVACVRGVDQVAVLNLASSDAQPIVLRGSGYTIWNRIDGHSDTRSLVEAIAREYGVEPDEVEQDVHRFVDVLRQRGLIEPVDSPART